MKRTELLFGFIRVPLDFLTTFSAFLIAYKLRQVSDFIPFVQLPLHLETFPVWEEFKSLSAIGSLFFIVILALSRGYSFKSTARFTTEMKRVLIAGIIWLMAIISYYFIIREFPFSRLALFYSWIIAITAVCFGRFILKSIEISLLKRNIGRRRILFIGNNQISADIYRNLKKSPLYKIIGVIDDSEKEIADGPQFLGNTDDLEKIVQKKGIEEIIQTTSNLQSAKSLDIVHFCRTHHIQYHFVPDLLSVHHTNVEVSILSGLPLISIKPTPLDGWGKIIKRTADIVSASVGIVILSPILLIIAFWIKLDSKGPILFSRLEGDTKVLRVGQFGKLFHFIKFRTMIPNSHHLRYTALADKNIRGNGPLVKLKNDPRVTRFGKFLRKTSLDELPQLWSVLKGDMSLVGPRPHLPEEVAKYKDYQKFVLEIKPGITGLPQVSGRSDLSFDEEIRLDTYYIENWSLWMDLKILIKTIFAVARRYEE